MTQMNRTRDSVEASAMPPEQKPDHLQEIMRDGERAAWTAAALALALRDAVAEDQRRAAARVLSAFGFDPDAVSPELDRRAVGCPGGRTDPADRGATSRARSVMGRPD
jgi:uncharacterized membrane protein